MKKILMIGTGGTIASLPTDRGLSPGLNGTALAGLLPQGVLEHYAITVRDILHLDSSNIQPEEWQTIARHVYENRTQYDGIVITHGTDTMAYTASVLSFMLQGRPAAHDPPPYRWAGQPAHGAGHGGLGHGGGIPGL